MFEQGDWCKWSAGGKEGGVTERIEELKREMMDAFHERVDGVTFEEYKGKLKELNQLLSKRNKERLELEGVSHAR